MSVELSASGRGKHRGATASKLARVRRWMRADGTWQDESDALDVIEASADFGSRHRSLQQLLHDPATLRAHRLVVFPALTKPRESIRALELSFSKGREPQDLTMTFIDRLAHIHHAPLNTDLLHQVLVGYPTRKPNNFPRQKNITGFHWFGNHPALVPFESLLEQSWLRWVEWRLAAVSVASQPILITGTLGDRRITHTPDFLAQRADGTYALVNVKPKKFLADPEIADQFAALTVFLATVGIEHVIWSEPDPQADANLKWISRMRNPDNVPQDVVDAATHLYENEDTYGVLENKLWRTGHGLSSRPAIDRLLWTRDLAIEMDYPLDQSTPLYRPENLL